MTPKDSDECPINEFVSYKTTAAKIVLNNYGFDITDGPRSPTFEITTPIKEDYIIKAGGNTSFRQGNTIQASITVCGQETIREKENKI